MDKMIKERQMTRVSVVVPVYNEEGNVAELHREIKEVCEANQYDYIY